MPKPPPSWRPGVEYSINLEALNKAQLVVYGDSYHRTVGLDMAMKKHRMIRLLREDMRKHATA